MLRHAMSAERQVVEEKLSLKARQCLAIKRINQNLYTSSQSHKAILVSRMSIGVDPGQSLFGKVEFPDVFVSLKVKTLEWYKRKLDPDVEKEVITAIQNNLYLDESDSEEAFLVKKVKQNLQKADSEVIHDEQTRDERKRHKALMKIFEMFIILEDKI